MRKRLQTLVTETSTLFKPYHLLPFTTFKGSKDIIVVLNNLLLIVDITKITFKLVKLKSQNVYSDNILFIVGVKQSCKQHR